MRKLLEAGVVAVLLTLFGSANVYAADEGPTVSDAHEFISDMIGSGVVYARSPKSYRYSNYQGSHCTSTMNWGDDGADMCIGWSGITSVAKSEDGTIGVTIYGVMLTTMSKGEAQTDRFKQASFYVIDEASRKRLEKAMTLLVNSCAKKSKSKFD
jgi:hypothetical protein